ncbi:MAG TPA: heavy metal translocating P-type ATPase [Candidatus Alistipes avicola]|uniref:P-type Cu(+) transporter n=1 Tax=Candidatus Alistipes avicola TaxID=2838432 RepID=A0A9D2L3W8_9BACT|nr:heavy metal translocating P-type ATPase [Candidatus Alistipes avicola]
MVKSKIEKRVFPIEGLRCAGCAGRVEKTLNAQPGVIVAAVNLAAANATVEYDATLTTPEMLRKAVQEAGYDMVVEIDDNTSDQLEQKHLQAYRSLKRRTLWAVLLSLPVVAIGMFFMETPYGDWVMALLATPVVFWLGRGFFINAWTQLRHGSATMDTLVALSTGIAYLFSLFNLLFPEFWLAHGIEPHVYFEASCVIVAFILLGRLLEEKAKGNTATSLKKLIGLQPRNAEIIREDGSQAQIPINRIRVGDILLVRPGDRVPVDGTVMEGGSYVDESMLSGEPVAVRKEAGSKVFAGTINQKGYFQFRADKVGAETMLAQIIRMVQEAQGSKAPVQKLVDKVAGVFVPVIIGLALLAFVLWVTLDPETGLTHGFLALVTVLIIACPCALGLATPTAIMVGIGKGAELGILIKDAESLEIAGKVNTVVLDKTGTLTEGCPVVTDMVWLHGDDRLKEVFCSLERLSEHPLAEAIVQHFRIESNLQVQQFESRTGRGIRGVVDGETYMVGNSRMLEDNGITIARKLDEVAWRLSSEHKSIVWFADAEQALAVAAITDRVKDTSVEAVRRLQAAGIEVCMLTGDNRETARHIAIQVGIDRFESEMLPQDKALFVRRLQEEGRKVAMVGDGINDSAALAQADLSIAMGHGSDIAMDVAKITVVASDLNKIPEAIRLSKQTVRTIRQNLFWAFIYNLIGVPIAAGILYPVNGFLLNPMIAGAAMALSSVSVVTNSLRLKYRRK